MIENLEDHEYLLRASGLYSIYKGSGDAPNVVALRGLNLDIKQGEFVAAVGPSGSGKSTLLRCIGGLQHPSAGSINYGDQDITKLSEDELVPIRRDTVGFVFQSPNLIGSITAFQNVVRTLQYSGVRYSLAKKRAKETLELLGMTSRMHAYPSKLSGGERQRIGIARALVTNPRLILADEPTGNIDHENTENVMGLFQDLHNDLDISFFIVTHSQYVSSFADRNLELRDGIFLGEHRGGIQLDDLTDTRSIIINPNGSLNFPPELLGMIDTYGTLWNMDLKMKTGIPEIKLRPANGNSNSTDNGHKNCPVCKQEVAKNALVCKGCGAKLMN